MKILVENLILDVPILFSAVMFFLRGWNKGIVRPMMNFLSFSIATFLSGFVSFFVSSFLYNNLLKNLIIEKFYDISSRYDIQDFPKFLLFIFNFCGAKKDLIGKIIHKSNSGEILFNLVSPFVINLLRILIGSLVFGILIFVFRKISRMSCHIFSAPILSQFNSFLGAIIGVLKGIFIIWGCILFLKVALIYWDSPPEIFSVDSIQCSFLFSKFYNFNPLSFDFLGKISFIENLDVLKCLTFLR